MSRLRLIQVGLGFWGRNWVEEVLPTVAEVEVVAHVDPSPEARRLLHERTGVAEGKCFASLGQAMAAVEAEAVLATLLTAHHVPVVTAALAAGKHVIVEKPFTPTLAEGAELVRLARRSGLVLMVSHNYRHSPAAIAAAELVHTRGLGRVSSVAIDFRRFNQAHRYPSIPDPLLADMSIHHFDLMRMVLGKEPVEASCRTWNLPDSHFANHPAGTATILFESGAVVSYRGNWLSRGPETPWAGEWAVDCDDGAFYWTSRGSFAEQFTADRLAIRRLGSETAPQALEPIRHYDRAGTVATFAEAIRTGATPPRFSSGADNLKSLALMTACIRSAGQGGIPVRVAGLLPEGFA
jgi:predicted dehydrogenase